MLEKPELRREYEPLAMPDGTWLINGFSGRQVQVKHAPAAAADLFRLLDGSRTREQIAHELAGLGHAGAEVERALSFLDRLSALRIVTESLEATRPAEISSELFARFQTEIAAFQRFERPGTSAFDYFLRLRHSKVTIIGAGGNGSIAAIMLAAAGVGRLHLVDGDVVSEGNLVRQVFYTEADAAAGALKVDALRSRIHDLSRFTEVTVSADYVGDAARVRREIEGSDCVLLAADAPRFVINTWVNEACRAAGVPYINAFAGLIGPFTIPGQTACFDCLQMKYRKALGGDVHDQIVEALQARRSAQYPSFVIGVVQTALHQTDEIVNFLTQIKPPDTLDAILRVTNGAKRLEKFDADEFCSFCAQKREVQYA